MLFETQNLNYFLYVHQVNTTIYLSKDSDFIARHHT